MTNLEKIQINWSEWLKQLLFDYGLWNIEIPKFDQIIELTQRELIVLKEKLMKKTLEWINLKDAVSQLIKEKLDWTRKTVESTVTSITWQETAMLKERVSNWENYINSQIEAIKSINVSKRLNEINLENLSIYDSWLVLLIGQLANSGIQKTDLTNINNFRELIKEMPLDPTMKQISNKTLEILDSQNDMLIGHITSSWTKTVDMAYKNAPSIKEASDSMSLWKMIPEWNFIWDFANKYPKSFSLLAVSWAVLSLWFIWKMFFWWWNKEWWNKEWWKESWWFFSKLFDKFKWWLLWWAWIFGILWLGKLVWVDKIKEYVKNNLGIEVDETRLLKAIESYKKWEYMEMIKILVFWNEKIEKAKESEEFYKNVSVDMHDKWYTKDLRNWQEIKYIKEYAWGTTTNFLTWFWSWINVFVWLFWEDTEAFLHTKAFRTYIEKETKRLNIEIKKDDKVEWTLKMIMEKNKSQPTDDWTPPKKKIEASEQLVWLTWWAVVWWVLAWTQLNWSDLEDVDPTKKDWVDHSSLSNPVLYYWVKWKRLKTSKKQIQFWIRQYIEQLEWNVRWLPQIRQEVRDMKQIESLLGKQTLNEADKKKLAWLLDLNMDKFLKLPFMHFVSGSQEYVKLLESNPKLKEELLKEQEKIRNRAEKYHNEINQLVKKKYDLIKKWETALKKMADKWWFSIKDYMEFKNPLKADIQDWKTKLQNPIGFSWNEFSEYSRLHTDIITEVAKVDEELTKKTGEMNKKQPAEIEKVNKLFEKHHLKTEENIMLKEWFFWGLDKVWYKIKSLPWAWIWRAGFSVGFTSIMVWTLLDERATWKTNEKWEKVYKKDLQEAGLWLLPIFSEYYDFKAAITWNDLAWRDLTVNDRFIRWWFWLVWTVADLASIITLGQSEWLRVRLAWAKWTTKVAELAWKMWWMDKFSKALFEFSRWGKFVWIEKSEKLLKYIKATGKTWRIVNYSALWVATYQVAHETHLVDFLPDGKIYNSWKAIINKVKTDWLTWD